MKSGWTANEIEHESLAHEEPVTFLVKTLRLFGNVGSGRPQAERTEGHARAHSVTQAPPRVFDGGDHLPGHGWLLIGCGHREQGLALWKSVRRRRGILVIRYDLGS